MLKVDRKQHRDKIISDEAIISALYQLPIAMLIRIGWKLIRAKNLHDERKEKIRIE